MFLIKLIWSNKMFQICLTHQIYLIRQIWSNWFDRVLAAISQCLIGLTNYVSFFFLKLVSAIFHQFFIFKQMIALQKLWKMFFISSKKLFSFSRYSNFYVSVFPSFSSVSHCFRGWFNINLIVCGISTV